MGRFLFRRLLIAIPSLLGISIVLFVVLALAPGDPFGELASNPNAPLFDAKATSTSPLIGLCFPAPC